jgi:hypothetical protein
MSGRWLPGRATLHEMASVLPGKFKDLARFMFVVAVKEFKDFTPCTLDACDVLPATHEVTCGGQ